MNQFFSKYKRETIIVAIVLLVVLVIWYLVRRAQTPTSAINPNDQPTDITNNYAQIANRVRNAIEMPSTDEQDIIQAFEGINNQNDYNQVYNAFGTVFIFGIDGFGFAWNSNMNEAIRYELNSTELNIVNNWLRARNIQAI